MREGIQVTDEQIVQAFSTLMGINGDKYAYEIIEDGSLSEKSYKEVCDNVYFNGQESIMEHFGLVQWYYFQSKRF